MCKNYFHHFNFGLSALELAKTGRAARQAEPSVPVHGSWGHLRVTWLCRPRYLACQPSPSRAWVPALQSWFVLLPVDTGHLVIVFNCCRYYYGSILWPTSWSHLECRCWALRDQCQITSQSGQTGLLCGHSKMQLLFAPCPLNFNCWAWVLDILWVVSHCFSYPGILLLLLDMMMTLWLWKICSHWIWIEFRLVFVAVK